MKPLDCMDVYADAAFYDQEFATRSHDIPFFVRQAKQADGPVLEVACGTGRITLPIAREGIGITGLDVSRPMLELAERKAQAERLAVTWLEQDCRDIRVDQPFSLIFSATNAMQHLQDLDSVQAFFGSVRGALRADGLLVLDVFNPDIAKLSRPASQRYLHKTMADDQGRELRVETASHYEPATQVLVFTLFYMRGAQSLRTKQVRMRCFFPEELLALCRLGGLEVVHRYGDYDEQTFSATSPKQILLCRAASDAAKRFAV
ncbi:class I SAM-dependent methyltransferase [Dyella choica]|uniref:Class I SAM-dependent methyltransferase n=1 Tax=Dyella choica TaxID=1927959 RepID=A0A432M5S2_9GAMM|nr:class I SAM-dependent methyltransferase [Dyella choica]RUL75419.1 class I SAM-dependent methyltransferase [Dyella choica]